ncbi:ATP-dependent RNA helicase SUV3 [Xylariaceae sp. FL0016]|nr:ATP-dependent RNA helicase SUV3 [Xylariaceae sp. FL0016]
MRSFVRSGPARARYATNACLCRAFSNTTNVAREKTPTKIIPIRKISLPPFGSYIPEAQLSDLKESLLDGVSSGPGHSRRANQHTSKTYNTFRKLALNRFSGTINNQWSWKLNQESYAAFGCASQLDFDRETKLFSLAIGKACDLATTKNAVSRQENPLFWSLRRAFVDNDLKGLSDHLLYSFRNFLMRSRFPQNIDATHRSIADFRYPYEWFPATRALQRTIHLHVGPTNSGKTYNALKALENAKSGIYAGPLRLLAHEVYSRFKAKGKPCALITGEEQRIPENEDNYFRSCTVEMTTLNTIVDVAVIDEIQMIGDNERGWAWTQAFLGVQAREVHLCGEERAVPLIQSLCATLGDKCEVHRYQRLSGLETMNTSLRGKLQNLEKGDAVIAFSRLGIHALKKQIEGATKKRCAIVYGSLPPETRAQQAALFNDPNNDYDYLCASDAIGMGLNLEIKRVVFETTLKRSNNSFREISTSEIKQIGGRAGRFRTANQATQAGSEGDLKAARSEPRQPGLVTALEDEDLAVVAEGFRREPEPIKTAGLQPPPAVIERFSTYFPPNTPLSYILLRLRDIAQVSGSYHLCGYKEMLQIADLIQPFKLSIYDRCVFLNAPAALRERGGAVVLQAFARCVGTMQGGNLLDIPEVNLELLDQDESDFGAGPNAYLQALESLHKAITLYLWLSYRYSGVFRSQNLAFYVKGLVEAKIDDQLAGVQMRRQARKATMNAARKQAELRERMKAILAEGEDKETASHEVPGDWNEEGHEEPLYEDPSQLEQIAPAQHEERTGKTR